jgi:hypothetical protein
MFLNLCHDSHSNSITYYVHLGKFLNILSQFCHSSDEDRNGYLRHEIVARFKLSTRNHVRIVPVTSLVCNKKVSYN